MVLALTAFAVPDLGGKAGSLTHPSELPGCFCAIEADEITGLADAAAIVTVPTQGNDFAQGVAGQRPTFETNEVGVLPIMRFVRASTRLLSDASLLGGTGNQLTYAAVLKRTSVGTLQGIFTIGPNPNGRSFAFSAANALNLQKTSAVDMASSTTLVAGTSAYVIVGVTYDGRVASFFVNGIAAGAAVSAQTFSDGGGVIGAYGTTNTLDADVAAVFASNVVLSAADLGRLWRYWSSKWSVPLG